MSERTFGTGIKQEVEPLRTYDYEKAFGAVNTTVDFPSYYILPKDKIGIIKNQGSVGACVGCVISSLVEIFEQEEAKKDGRKLAGDEIEFSEGWAYGALRDESDNFYGMYVSKALEYCRKIGVVPKKYFNFLEEMPKMRQRVNAFPELYEEAKRYKIKSYVNLNYMDDEKRDLAIKEAIYNREHGLLAVSNSFFGECHCIMLIGWNDKTNRYIIKNSWGEKWSGDGCTEVPKNRIDEVYLITDEEITIPFKDVLSDDWYYGDIKNVYLGGLMNGISETEFAPEKNITRAEFSTLLSRLVNLTNERLENIVKILKIKNNKADGYYISSKYLIQKTQTDEIKFTDVIKDSWYYNDVITAYEYGLIKGKTEELFEPETNMTRAEIATVIVRICSLFLEKLNYILNRSGKKEIVINKQSISFSDVATDAWYYDAIKMIVNLEIMNGKDNNYFEPEGFATRGEIAAIINRLSKYIDSKNYIAFN